MARSPARPGAGSGVAAPLAGELVPEQFDVGLGGLAGEHEGAGLVQGDGPAAGPALGRPAVQLAGQGDDLTADGQFLGVGVDVVAVQAGGLAAAQAAQRDQPPQRREAVIFHPV
jgi:hypothetical protein